MSDAEARERRKNRLLASKEDRMSKILSSMSKNGGASDEQEGNGSEERQSPAVPQKKPAVTSEKPAAQIKQATTLPTSKPVKTETKVKESQIGSQVKQEQVKACPSRLGHVLVVALSAVIFFAIYQASLGTKFSVYFGKPCCEIIQERAYTILISVFCAVETEEFLFGRLSKSDGSPMDVSLLVKDFVLFVFSLLFMSYLQQTFLV